MRLFLDTSAFIKRYVEEPGSKRVLELTTSADELGLSILILPESVSTLSRLLRENRLIEADYDSLKMAILADVTDADLCDLTQTVMKYTISCLERSPLRALDAIHVGSACAYRPDLFVSADRRQILAAEREGLHVEDLSNIVT